MEESDAATLHARIASLEAKLALLQQQMAGLKQEAINEALAAVQIQSGQFINVSGGNGKFTLNVQLPRAVSNAGATDNDGAQWYELELCDGTMIEVRVRNVTAPA